ncbi:MAG: hypothetical protein COA84_13770 [Robiginitomaculum sp.]|nr:MAG: hypothetical protein COA84_13770 [Robiginitomaculum sp.]
MRFQKQMYVGFQKSQREDCLLGFSIPVATGKGFENRKNTVDGWRDKKIEPKIFDNDPHFGFQIIDVVARHRGNKVYRLKDPRGFELEITAQNVLDIIAECTLTKGVIADKMLWAGAYLAREASKDYQDHLAGPKTWKLSPGMVLTNEVNNVLYKYMGKFHYAALGFDNETYYPEGHYYHNNGSYYSSYGYNRNRNNGVKGEVTPTYTLNTQSKTAFAVYAKRTINKDGKVSKKVTYDLRKSHILHLRPVDTAFGKDKLKTNEWIDWEIASHGGHKSYGNSHMLFADKKEANAFTATLEELKPHAPDVPYYRRNYPTQDYNHLPEKLVLET